MPITRLVYRKFLPLFFIAAASFGLADEIFDNSLEWPALQNIRQVTFPTMGFSKAGEGYFSPDGKTIIFQAVPNGQSHYQIYTLDLSEGVPKMVSTGIGACTCANFSPDGKKIIFASSHSDPNLYDPEHKTAISGYQRTGGNYVWDFTPYMNIYKANPDGSELEALTTGEAYHAECAFSSDGSEIVFASNESGSMNLYTMRVDGSEIKQITHTETSYNGGPFFSPDGSLILFRADREKKHYLQLYLIDKDGNNERQLTFNGAVNWAPYWYPNGKVIAYTTSLHGHSHYEIYLQNIETSEPFRLTHNSSFDGLPVFSFKGTKLLWTSKRGEDESSQLFIADFTLPENLK